MKKQFLFLLLCGSLLSGMKKELSAQEPYVGEIRMVSFNFAPQGWALCNGQLLSIAQYSALFSLIGTTYGGNGTTTFAVPDMRGRVPISYGQGPGLANYPLGSTGGVENVTLSVAQLPAHTHGMGISKSEGTTPSPAGNYLGNTGTFDNEYAATADSINANMIQSTGENRPHENRQPYVTINYIISLQGLYPSQN